MSTLSFRDIKQISAYLDGQLNQSQQTRLEARLKAEPELAQALDELRQVKSLLRKTPHRRAPRNFTLTPKMAGIKPPVPRVVPALSWASAVASILFVFTLGLNFLGGSLSAASPKAAPMVANGAGIESTQPPAGLAPLATTAPQDTQSTLNATATPDDFSVTYSESPDQSGLRSSSPSTASQARPPQPIPWLYIWPGLALLLIGAALLIRWLNARNFVRRVRNK
jgi:hypothetical protein